MKSEYTWTLITVTYNNEAEIKNFWGNFERSDSIEWIVIDNNSTDESASVAKTLGANVIELGQNFGFSHANNIGLKVASGEYICFLNPDVSITASGLQTLKEAINRYNGLVAPQLLNNDLSLQPNGRGAPTLLNKILSRLNNNRVKANYYLFSQPGQVKKVDWVIGAAVAARKTTFKMLGGWDDAFFVYYEDTDLCIRAEKNGLGVWLVGDCQWVHGWARETSGLNLRAWKYELRSMIKFYSRYPRLILSYPRKVE